MTREPCVYRREAARLRALAASEPEPHHRHLLKIADDYEELAKRLGPPQVDRRAA
jgi:hypothetical protein